MNAPGLMTTVAVGACIVAIVAGAPGPEVFWGMAGPLVAGVVTWSVVQRVVSVAPGQLTAVMVKAFAVKMLFFAGYVAVMLRGLGLRPTAFVVGFTAFFVGVYGMEAWLFARLFGRLMAPVKD